MLRADTSGVVGGGVVESIVEAYSHTAKRLVVCTGHGSEMRPTDLESP